MSSKWFGEGFYRKEEPATQRDPQLPTGEENGLPSLPEVIDEALTPQQCTAIGHLVAGMSYSSTAVVMKISRKTLYNWRQLPAFKHALNTISREALQAVATRVRNILLRETRVLEAKTQEYHSMTESIRVIANKRLWDIASILPEDEETDEETAARPQDSTETRSSHESENLPMAGAQRAADSTTRDASTPAPAKPDSPKSARGRDGTARRGKVHDVSGARSNSPPTFDNVQRQPDPPRENPVVSQDPGAS